MKQKREQRHNFIEVENEITYAELIVYKPRAKNLIPFRHYTIDVAYLIFGDLCKPKNLIYRGGK